MKPDLLKELSPKEKEKLSEFKDRFLEEEEKNLKRGFRREETKHRVRNRFEYIKRIYPGLIPPLKSFIKENLPRVKEVLADEFPSPPPPNPSPSPAEDYEMKKARLLREKYQEMLSRLSPENQERCFKSWERREVGEEEWWDIEQRVKEMKLWFFSDRK